MPTLKQINNELFKQMSFNDFLYGNLLGSYNDRLVLSYRNASKNITADMAKLYASMKGKPSLSKAHRFNNLEKLFKKINTELKLLGVAEKNIDTRAITETLNTMYTRAAYSYEKSLATTFSTLSLLPKDTIQAALVNPLSAIKWEDSIKKNLESLDATTRVEITEGIIRGRSFKDVSRDVADNIVNIQNGEFKGAVTKAFGIVSTETHRVQNLGNDLAFDRVRKSSRSLGIEEPVKIWLSTIDTVTRPSHRAADGKEANSDGMFELFGVVFSSPGNSGIAEEDIRCRCAYYVAIPGLTNKKRFDNIAKKPIPNITYCQWYKGKYKKIAKGCT